MKRVFVVVAAAVLVALVLYFAGGMIQIASGSVSKTVCSGTFVSGLAPETVYAHDLRPEGGMGLIDWALSYDVDRTARRVSTTVFGVFASSARFHDGYGCRLEFAGDVPLGSAPVRADVAAAALDIAGPEIVAAADPALARAIDAAFDDSGTPQWTQAVVVVHGGRVIAERYGPGIGIDTPLVSHSIAKSVINALIGILVRDGAVKVDQPVRGPAWEAEVTVDQLLRMDSGLPLDEGMGPGLAQRMWFTESDNAAFAENWALAEKPGTKWAYSNLGYAALARVVRDAAGRSPANVSVFAERELFAPLGMRRALMEFDSGGSPMGGNSFFASARDWARFGLLYLNDGVVGGRRILPEGWVAYSRKQTLDAGYGAGFWLNVVDTPIPQWGNPWGMPGAPKDAFFARGYLGQFIVVVPSEDLVVVRLGVSHTPGGGIERAGALVRDVIDALHQRNGAGRQ